jgi:hypothetical protein
VRDRCDLVGAAVFLAPAGWPFGDPRQSGRLKPAATNTAPNFRSDHSLPVVSDPDEL